MSLIVLAMLALLPVAWAWRMIFFYVRSMGPVPAGGPWPRACVLLCVRGDDPSLVACLEGLLRQDYPDYQVRIVVDSEVDPAWPVIHAVLARHEESRVRVQVEVLRQPLATCSLKVSGQLQALSDLEGDFEAVVLIDADAVPAPDWLRAMVLPLRDPAVGAATGIRWFAPPPASWGALIRHAYNAGSYPHMMVFHCFWGGSLALRAEVFRSEVLRQVWAHSFCDDNSLSHVLRQLNLRLAFVAAATQVNAEDIDLNRCRNFILRQLLCVRLDHILWWPVFVCNQLTSLALMACAALAALGLGLGRGAWALLPGGVVAVYLVGMFGALLTMESLIRRNARLRGVPVPPWRPTWRIVPAALGTLFLAGQLMVAILRPRKVVWRGITYDIAGPGRLRLREHRPYAAAGPVAAGHSVT
jgi:hypothetical protein